MMKQILLSFIFIAFVFGASNAQSNYLGTNDAQAKAVLKKVSAKYKALKTLTARVTMEVSNTQGKRLSTQSGTMFLKGSKYYWNVGDQTAFSDGRSAYDYDRDSKEITVTRIDPKDNMITPQKLFTDFYDQGFIYVLSGKTTRGGKTISTIELTPRDKTQPYFKVALEVENATSTILSARVFEKNGTRYTYTISNPRYNAAIADSKFVYSKAAYPGVELVDLR